MITCMATCYRVSSFFVKPSKIKFKESFIGKFKVLCTLPTRQAQPMEIELKAENFHKINDHSSFNCLKETYNGLPLEILSKCSV